jgi:hypothetical protein
LRSGRLIDRGDEKSASVEGNERDQQTSNESKVTPKKWYASSHILEHVIISLMQFQRSYIDNYKSLPPSSVRKYR